MNSEYIDIKWVSQDYLARCWFQTSFLISAFLMLLLYHTVFCKLSVAAYKWNHTASVFFCVAYFTSVSSVAQSCLTLCDPMDCSTPGSPVLPSPSPGVCSNSCPLSLWCHPAILFSVIPFSSCCLQSFPASGSFLMSQLFDTGGQNIQRLSFQWIFRIDFL